MSLALRVSEVVAFVVVHCHAERAVHLTLVVAAEIGVFRQIDRFQCQQTQAFFSRLSIAVSRT